MAETFDVDVNAMGLRYLLLSAHYRQPIEAGESAINAARKATRRLLMAATPTKAGPPIEIINCLADDLNTPKALALCHGYRKAKRGEELFASLRFLGFLGVPSCPDDIRMIPADHLPPAEIMGGMETGKLFAS